MHPTYQAPPQPEVLNIRTPKAPIPGGSSALALGIIGLVLSFTAVLSLFGIILSIVGLTTSNKALRAYNEAPTAYDDSNLGQIKAGRICSIIGLCLGSIYFLFFILYMVIIASVVAAAGSGQF